MNDVLIVGGDIETGRESSIIRKLSFELATHSRITATKGFYHLGTEYSQRTAQGLSGQEARCHPRLHESHPWRPHPIGEVTLETGNDTTSGRVRLAAT